MCVQCRRNARAFTRSNEFLLFLLVAQPFFYRFYFCRIMIIASIKTMLDLLIAKFIKVVHHSQ